MIAILVSISILLPLWCAALVVLSMSRWPIVRAHIITIGGMALSSVVSWIVWWNMVVEQMPVVHAIGWNWIRVGDTVLPMGLWIDSLSANMGVMITSISLLVHIYSVAYMQGESGQARFFAVVSFFTAMMMLLVYADNLGVLFIGWEGVGVASYALISFYFQRESAVQGGMKAFLVNRVADVCLVLGLASCLWAVGSLQWVDIWAAVPQLAAQKIGIAGYDVSVAAVVGWCFLLGAMGKSAQMPLHVWLPESMEGPTPISALIHAATMVTAGIYLVCRMGMLYDVLPEIQAAMRIIGATGALSLGVLALVQHDIKRIAAYSTLSHLGYMMAAVGSGAYALALFHLFTHAAFKALIFLGCGAVIIAMHHEQDGYRMGGLAATLPQTFWSMVLASLALSALPPFSGFYSKDAVIEAMGTVSHWSSWYTYGCLLLGSMVTPMYASRLVYLVFLGQPRSQAAIKAHQVSQLLWMPLVVLAIPSVLLGVVLAPVVGDGSLLVHTWIGEAVTNAASPLYPIYQHLQHPWEFAWHAWQTVPFWLVLLGALLGQQWAYYQLSMAHPPEQWPNLFSRWLRAGYGFDALYHEVGVRGTRRVSEVAYQQVDDGFIDRGLVHRLLAQTTQRVASWMAQWHSGMVSQMLLQMVIMIVVVWIIRWGVVYV